MQARAHPAGSGRPNFVYVPAFNGRYMLACEREGIGDCKTDPKRLSAMAAAGSTARRQQGVRCRVDRETPAGKR